MGPRGAANSRPFVVLIRKTYAAPIGLGRIFTGDQKIAATTIGSRALSRFLAGKRHDIAYVSHPARTIAPPSSHQFHTRAWLIGGSKIGRAAIGGLHCVRRLVRKRGYHHGIGKTLVRRPISKGGAKTVESGSASRRERVCQYV